MCTNTIRPRQPFVEKLDTATAKKDCGLYLFEDFLSQVEAEEAFNVVVEDTEFPWDTKPDFPDEYETDDECENELLEFSRVQKKKRGKIKADTKLKGLLKLGEICSKIERDFDVKVSFVFCNWFKDPEEKVDWHRESHGENICVLTLGSKRRVEFLNDDTQTIEAMTPGSGDLYMVPPRFNETHHHRVCSAIETDPSGMYNGARLSFVFFFEAPKYAKDFNKDTLIGSLLDMSYR